MSKYLLSNVLAWMQRAAQYSVLVNVIGALSPACTHLATVLQHNVATVSSVISEVCCNTIIHVHPPCSIFNVCAVVCDLYLLQGGCMIVLRQTSLITLETVATFCCNTVARCVYFPQALIGQMTLDIVATFDINFDTILYSMNHLHMLRLFHISSESFL